MSCFLHYLHSSRNYLQFIAVRVIVANLVANHVIEQKLVNFVSEKVIYVNRFESTIFGLWTLLAYNFEGLGMRKWNIPTNRAHKIVERNGVICLLTMFTSGVMVIKISQMTHFLYFLLLMTAKSQRVWANELLDSDLPLSKTSTLENADFGIVANSSSIFLPSLLYLTNGNSKIY